MRKPFPILELSWIDTPLLTDAYPRGEFAQMAYEQGLEEMLADSDREGLSDDYDD